MDQLRQICHLVGFGDTETNSCSEQGTPNVDIPSKKGPHRYSKDLCHYWGQREAPRQSLSSLRRSVGLLQTEGSENPWDGRLMEHRFKRPWIWGPLVFSLPLALNGYHYGLLWISSCSVFLQQMDTRGGCCCPNSLKLRGLCPAPEWPGAALNRFRVPDGFRTGRLGIPLGPSHCLSVR